ncbi:hypothetical protein [Marinobacter sp.]|uniref:hypothetical protein n=1 Tax=Marinobacter sp. TaxID=50741 RepID=UPI00257F1581|nr:hypothetical protein [Marinobacter sp.]|tara:strand:- start:243 stop:434 length:192 start_codon:yes stop_codon:yes gene_type:complete
MMDVDLPPVKKYAVVNDEDTILLITSGLQIASWYQLMYDKNKPPSDYRISCVDNNIFRKDTEE